MNDHATKCSTVKRARRERRETLWEKLQWRKKARRLAEENALDENAAFTSALLRQHLRAAETTLVQTRRELADVEASAGYARKELEEVRRDGPSFGRAATAGAHLLRRLSEKVQSNLEELKSERTIWSY